MAIVIPTEADSVIGSFKVNLAEFPVNGTLNYYTANEDAGYDAYVEFKFEATEDVKKAAAEILNIPVDNVGIYYSLTDSSCSIAIGPAGE